MEDKEFYELYYKNRQEADQEHIVRLISGDQEVATLCKDGIWRSCKDAWSQLLNDFCTPDKFTNSVFGTRRLLTVAKSLNAKIEFVPQRKRA